MTAIVLLSAALSASLAALVITARVSAARGRALRIVKDRLGAGLSLLTSREPQLARRPERRIVIAKAYLSRLGDFLARVA